MNRGPACFVPLSLVLVAVSCSDSDAGPSNNVPSPDAGAGGVAGKVAVSGGSGGNLVGSGGSVSGGASGKGGGAPLPEGGSAGEQEEAGAAGTAGAAAGTQFDGSCKTLPGTVLYVESGDTQENLLKNLGRHLRDTANITVAFNLTGSCTLTSDMYTNAKVVKSGTLKYIPSTAEDPNWTVAMPEPTCTVDADGVTPDLAISALFVDSCGLGAAPANLALLQGPIQAYTFIVPTASEQNAIWAEEAYYTFGFGAANPLSPTTTPWNDPLFLFIRPTTKSTLVATAKNINVLPVTKWKGVQEPASSDVVTAVKTSAQPKPTIGILGAEVYDSNRMNGIRTLAFQAFDQKAAYFPDSTASAFDKQNVRDGHYTLWSPTVYITPVNGSQVPTNPAVKYLVDVVLGDTTAKPPNGGKTLDSLADVVKVGLIPDCAMKVSRTTDGGTLSPFGPAESCTCYYLSKVPNAVVPAGCTACSSSAQCGAGSCNHGYCEPDTVSTVGTDDGKCFTGTPTTHAQLINACTSSPGIVKAVTLPVNHPIPIP